MDTSWPMLLVAGFLLVLIQFLAAVPWLTVVTLGSLRALGRGQVLREALPRALVVLGVGTLVAAVGLGFTPDKETLNTLGRFYGLGLSFQLLLDVLVVVFTVMLAVWRRGGTVALAAFTEGVRQPMFWFLVVFALVGMAIMPFLPYFTFGEDLKMVKELGYDTIMLFAGLFAVLAAGLSISEEIEGRTAVTLMSKPVSRRQFLLGKFAGILMAAFLMTGLLSLMFLLILWLKPVYDREPFLPPAWIVDAPLFWQSLGTAPNAFWMGNLWWFADIITVSSGLILGFCQVMVLLAVAVALATRLPMVVNFPICLAIYFFGHLTPVLSQVSQNRFALVRFVADMFDTLLPGFEFFNIGPALTRDALPPAGPFAWYLASVTGYAVLYTAIALLFGLILFEDRDLA
jgi:ABC-type transport system involved in multi-copper enzyme maturation permease subunit